MHHIDKHFLLYLLFYSVNALASFLRLLRSLATLFFNAISSLLLLLIKAYQFFISPFLRPCCRFYPSCSVYAIQSLKKYGLFKGLYKIFWRLLRCHPLCQGGYEPP